MIAGKSGFERANNVGKSRSRGLPFDGRGLGGSTISSMPSLGGGSGGKSVQGVSQKDEAWNEYVDTIEDSLTESK